MFCNNISQELNKCQTPLPIRIILQKWSSTIKRFQSQEINSMNDASIYLF